MFYNVIRYRQVKRTTNKHLIGRTRKSIKEYKIRRWKALTDFILIVMIVITSVTAVKWSLGGYKEK